MFDDAGFPSTLSQVRYTLVPVLQNLDSLRKACDLVDRFQSEIEGHPQYADHLAKVEVAIVQLRRDTRSKSGKVGIKGQRLVGRVERDAAGTITSVVVYSPWSGFHVSLPMTYLKVLALAAPSV